MVKVGERKKKEKRGQPPLSDLGDPPLEEKQQRKRTRRASVPASLRRSRRLKANPDADKIRHGKPEKRVRIHPKKEEKQVSSSDFCYDICPDITAEECAFYEEHVLKKCDGSVVPSMRGVMAFRRGLMLPPCVETKKKEKRGQPPLSDLGDPPLEKKQQRKRTRRASVPASLRRFRRLKPNPDADKIRHGKPEKRVRIHPKKEEKQVSSSDFCYDICPDITAEECAFYEEHVLKKFDGSIVPSMRGVMAFRRGLMLPPCVETKKKENRGQPPLSDLGDPPLEKKQQRKRTRRASVPASLRRFRRLKPNPDADKIRHGKPEKRVRIHPKKEEKQVSSSDFCYDLCPEIIAKECAFYEEHVLRKSDGSFAPPMRGVMAFRRGLMLPPCVETKKKEKRGQPPLSDLGDPPLEEKQQRKQTRRASVPAPHRRSRRLNPNPDSDKIRHSKPKKRVGIHPKKEEKQVSSFDFYKDICNRHVMTAEEYAFYKEHVLKSDGFDVPSMREVNAYGLIQPSTINAPGEAHRFILYSNLAIDRYNTWIHTHMPESPQLKFRKVLKAMGRTCDVMRYYITFAAKEVAAGGQTKTYQAVVRRGLQEDDITVLSFRKCEQVEGSGIRAKEWIWKGHANL